MDKNEKIANNNVHNSTNNKRIIIDADNCIAGRICSRVSKLLLQGNKVIIINSEKAMISGNKYKIIDDYKKRLEVGSIINPIHGPYHPRRPDKILSKMVRGMIPRTKPSGTVAFKRLRVYMGIPSEFKDTKEIKDFEDTRITKSKSYYTTVGDVAKQIGWKGADN